MQRTAYAPQNCPLSSREMARIALNARLLVANRLEGIGWFTYECFRRIIAEHPEHEFRLLFDRPPHPEFDWGENASSVRLWPPARRPFLYDWWFDRSVARELNKWRADAFVSTDGMLCRRTSVPQLAVFHDLNFMHHPEWMPSREARYYRTRFPEFAKRAERVATVSQFSKEDIAVQFGIASSKIDVVYNAPSEMYRSATKLEAMEAEQHFAQGSPYFIFVGSLHPRKNMKGLLEAFRLYRNSGGINHLVVVGESMWKGEQVKADAVHFVGRLGRDELPLAMAGSQGLVFVPWFEGFGVPIVEAFASGVPVIASNATAMPEVCSGAAATLVDPGDAAQIADAMMKLERDPVLRADAIERGLIRAQDFSWDHSADALWKSIMHILPQ